MTRQLSLPELRLWCGLLRRLVETNMLTHIFESLATTCSEAAAGGRFLRLVTDCQFGKSPILSAKSCWK